MARIEVFTTSVAWTGSHRGRIRMGNGPELEFSAPPGSHGEAGVLTPEDAFVGAVNSCVMLMYLWAAERLRLDLVSYECLAEGTKLVELDRTEIFSKVVLKPRIVIRSAGEERAAVERRARRAMDSAVKYSLVANSIKSELEVEPAIEVLTPPSPR